MTLSGVNFIHAKNFQSCRWIKIILCKLPPSEGFSTGIQKIFCMEEINLGGVQMI